MLIVVAVVDRPSFVAVAAAKAVVAQENWTSAEKADQAVEAQPPHRNLVPV